MNTVATNRVFLSYPGSREDPVRGKCDIEAN